MAITERSRRLLWGRAAGRCAFEDCRRDLIMKSNATGDAANVGHEAHIVAEKTDGPRGVSPLTAEQRDDYSNLILLCRHHHGMIDDKVLRHDYPVERLHGIKATHETWVSEHLTGVDPILEAADSVYAHLVDEAVMKCRLAIWREWTHNTLQATPFWPVEVVGDVLEFRDRVTAAVFYGRRPRLEAALRRFAITLAGAALRFMDQAEQVNDAWYRGNQFYRNTRFLTYAKPIENLRSLYEYWRQDCYERMHDASAAANWLADEVRAAMDPMFFAVEGKFLLERCV